MKTTIQASLTVVVVTVFGFGVLSVGRAQETGVQEAGQGLTPFVLPWDDASPGITNLSGWLHKPAGKFGHVVATPDGHLRVGDQRIRFFGTDQSFCANFPLKPDGEKIAARMAKFGINIVRFHIMDLRRYPSGLFRKEGANTREFEPDAVDRMDYFIAQLKKNGIYVDLNLLNYRPFCEADGLPNEIEKFPSPYNLRAIPGFFRNKRMMELQKEYARMLLTHRNSYTGMTYTEDPAVAFVEICNENGLVHAWKRGNVDKLPEVFLEELWLQWNDWLRARYGSSDKLRQAWSVGEERLGDEMLKNAGPVPVLEDWDLENNIGAESTMVLTDDVPEELRKANPAAQALLIDVKKQGTEKWHVLLNRPGFDVEKDRSYTLIFWAKADEARRMPMVFAQTHEPWRSLCVRINPELTTEWQSFRFVLKASDTENRVRIMIGDLSRGLGTYWLAGMSLRPGGINGLLEGERLEDRSVTVLPLATCGQRILQVKRDWVDFLRMTEDGYWQEMYHYLKDDLKVKAQIIGTAGQYNPPSNMAKMDCVDAHAYWQHPRWPGGKSWRGPWIVGNRTMVNDTGGLFRGLSAQRILNKPFSVTEYGGASPNPHTGENLVLAGAYAALQDWDYIAVSRYTKQVADYSWDSGCFRGYFDVDQHPTRMLGFIAAAAMFRRGDVRSGEKLVAVPLGRTHELDALCSSHEPWRLIPSDVGGIPEGAALVHRVALATEGTSIPTGALDPKEVPIPGPLYASDTGELAWNRTDEEQGVVTVDTARSKAVIGFGAGRRFDLGGVVIEPGPTRQDGWSVVSLTAIEGNLTSAPARILVIATGDIENTDMKWTDEKKESVGRDWGTGPTLVETVPARLTFPVPAAKVRAWVLDECGQRKISVPVAASSGKTVLEIGPPQSTLWYEVEVQ